MICNEAPPILEINRRFKAKRSNGIWGMMVVILHCIQLSVDCQSYKEPRSFIFTVQTYPRTQHENRVYYSRARSRRKIHIVDKDWCQRIYTKPWKTMKSHQKLNTERTGIPEPNSINSKRLPRARNNQEQFSNLIAISVPSHTNARCTILANQGTSLFPQNKFHHVRASIE